MRGVARATCLVSIKSFVGMSSDCDIHTIVWIRVLHIEWKDKYWHSE